MSQKLLPSEVEVLRSLINKSRLHNPIYLSLREERFFINAINDLIEEGKDASKALADNVGIIKFSYMANLIRSAYRGSLVLFDFGVLITSPKNRLGINESKILDQLIKRLVIDLLLSGAQEKAIQTAYFQIKAGFDTMAVGTLFCNLPNLIANRISAEIRKEFYRHPTLQKFASGIDLIYEKGIVDTQLSDVFNKAILPPEKTDTQEPVSTNSDYKGVYVEMPKPDNEQLFDDVRQLLDLTKLTKYADVKSKIAEARLFDKGLVNRFSNFCFITEKGIQYLSDLNLLQCENLDGSTYCHHQY